LSFGWEGKRGVGKDFKRKAKAIQKKVARNQVEN